MPPSRVRSLWIAGFFATGVALAQGRDTTSSPTTHIEAALRASQARDALRHGDAREALRLFRDSLTADPTNPHVMREYAELLERSGGTRDAAEAWTRYSAIAPTREDRQAAIERSETLRRLPSVLRVRVLPALAAREARVWFDHDTPRVVPVGGAEASVDGGSHRVRVEAPGYVPFETMVTTGYGEPLEVVARMQRVPSGDAPPIVADGGRGDP
jgi:hypothetical protein